MRQVEGGCLLTENEFALVWADGRWGLHVPGEETIAKITPDGKMPTECLALTELLLRMAHEPAYVKELAEAYINRCKQSS